MNICTCDNLLTLFTEENELSVMRSFITEFEERCYDFSYADVDCIFERFGKSLFRQNIDSFKIEFVSSKRYQDMLRALKIISNENRFGFNIVAKDFTFNFDDVKAFINDISDDKGKLIELKNDLELLASYGLRIVSYDEKLMSRVISTGQSFEVLSDGKLVLCTDKLMQFEGANYLLTLRNRKDSYQKLLVKTLDFDKTLLQSQSKCLKRSCE